MSPKGGSERKPTRDEFVQEVIEAFRAAGLEGPIEYEDTLGTVTHTSGIGIGVHDLYEKMKGVPAENRLATLAKLARVLAKREKLPATWADAKDRLVPQLRRQMDLTEEAGKRSPLEPTPPRLSANLTPHVVIEPAFQLEGSSTLPILAETCTVWGVAPQQVLDTAIRNLERMSVGAAGWQGTAEYPGVFRSPWRDGLDASRLLLSHLFRAAPLSGRPVAVAPLPTMLVFAGSDDPVGLENLGRVTMKTLERQPGVHSIRPLRMSADGGSWEDWIPDAGHPARGALRLLRAIEEKRDYDRQGELQRSHPNPAVRNSAGSPLAIVRSAIAPDTMTVTVWPAGKPTALPLADAIIFRRGDEVLGYAAWDEVARALPNELRQLPNVYPSRFLAADFPEDWQLGECELRPWAGPLPT